MAGEGSVSPYSWSVEDEVNIIDVYVNNEGVEITLEQDYGDATYKGQAMLSYELLKIDRTQPFEKQFTDFKKISLSTIKDLICQNVDGEIDDYKTIQWLKQQSLYW